jgi:transposase-like protein
METKFKSLMDFDKKFPDEQSCRDRLEQARWHGEPVCAQCGSVRKIYHVADGKLLKCADCRRQFSVRVGTIFEDSALPLKKWFLAIYILNAHKKGISSCQLAKDIEVTQKTAWFMLHRIRYATKHNTFMKPLNGIVEVDETFVGGRADGRGHRDKFNNKTPVFGMVERQGEVRAMPVPQTNASCLMPIINSNISPDAVIMSDDYSVYDNLGRTLKDHKVVNHSKKEYVRGEAHTNTIEGFWSLMKRGINGIYHHVSQEHLHRYTDEFAYRYNSRKSTDPERFENFLERVEGRLTYKKLIE